MIHIEKLDDMIRTSYIKDDGTLGFYDLRLKKSDLWVWQQCPETDPRKDTQFKHWGGGAIKKVPVRSAREFSKFRVEELLFLLPQEVKDVIYKYVHPRKHFIDIEVLVEDEFPTAEEAKYPMTAIAIANDKDNIIVMGTKPLNAEELAFIETKILEQTATLGIKPTFRYDYFVDEYNMLYTFVMKVLPKIIFASGWNFTKYDWLYISNRCKKLNIPLEWSSVSKKYWQGNIPLHKIVVDYMDIYKKWDRSVALKEQDTLDWVAGEVLKVKKIKYSGSIKDLYEKDYPLYIAYNAVDAILVKMLDVKLQTLSTYLKIGCISNIEAPKAFSPVWLSDAICFRALYERKKIITPPNYADIKSQDIDSDFEGAYVKEPIKGMYDWICCYDFASLYPSTMRQFNISPDSYRGRSKSDMKEGDIITAAGTIFDNTFNSVFRELLDDYYGKRVVAKKVSKDCELRMEYIENKLKQL